MISEHLRRRTRHTTLHERYRQLLKRPGLSPEEIESMRQPMILLAKTICEHVWAKKVY